MKFTKTIQLAAQRGNLDLLKRLLSDLPDMPKTSWIPTGGSPDELALFGISHNVKIIADLINLRSETNQKAARLLIEKMLHNQSEVNKNYLFHLLAVHLLNPCASHATLVEWFIENHMNELLDMPVLQSVIRNQHVNELIMNAITDRDATTLNKLLHAEIVDAPDALHTPLLEQAKQFVPDSVKDTAYQVAASISASFPFTHPSSALDYHYNGSLNPRVFLTSAKSRYTLYNQVATGIDFAAQELSPECAHLVMPYALELDLFIKMPCMTDIATIEEKMYQYGLQNNPRVQRTLQSTKLLYLAVSNKITEFSELFNQIKHTFDVNFSVNVANLLIENRLPHFASMILNHQAAPLPVRHWEQCVQNNYLNILQIPGVTSNDLTISKLRELVHAKALEGNVAMVEYLCDVAKSQQMTMIFDTAPYLIKHGQSLGFRIVNKLAEIQPQPQMSYLSYFGTKLEQMASYLLTDTTALVDMPVERKPNQLSFFSIGHDL